MHNGNCCAKFEDETKQIINTHTHISTTNEKILVLQVYSFSGDVIFVPEARYIYNIVEAFQHLISLWV